MSDAMHREIVEFSRCRTRTPRKAHIMRPRFAAITVQFAPHISPASAESLSVSIEEMIAEQFPDVTDARVWEVWDPQRHTPTPLPQDPATYYAEVDEQEQ